MDFCTCVCVSRSAVGFIFFFRFFACRSLTCCTRSLCQVSRKRWAHPRRSQRGSPPSTPLPLPLLLLPAALPPRPLQSRLLLLPPPPSLRRLPPALGRHRSPGARSLRATSGSSAQNFSWRRPNPSSPLPHSLHLHPLPHPHPLRRRRSVLPVPLCSNNNQHCRRALQAPFLCRSTMPESLAPPVEP